MAILTTKQTWDLTVGTPELRLILAALDGALAPSDDEAAMELRNKLVRQRAAVTDHMLRENAKLQRNLAAGRRPERGGSSSSVGVQAAIEPSPGESLHDLAHEDDDDKLEKHVAWRG